MWIGQMKNVHISMNPGQNFKFLEPDDSLESKLQLGPVNLDGQLFPVRKEQCGMNSDKVNCCYNRFLNICLFGRTATSTSPPALPSRRGTCKVTLWTLDLVGDHLATEHLASGHKQLIM